MRPGGARSSPNTTTRSWPSWARATSRRCGTSAAPTVTGLTTMRPVVAGGAAQAATRPAGLADAAPRATSSVHSGPDGEHRTRSAHVLHQLFLAAQDGLSAPGPRARPRPSSSCSCTCAGIRSGLVPASWAAAGARGADGGRRGRRPWCSSSTSSGHSSIEPPRADLCHAVSNGLAALPALAAKWRRHSVPADRARALPPGTAPGPPAGDDGPARPVGAPPLLQTPGGGHLPAWPTASPRCRTTASCGS